MLAVKHIGPLDMHWTSYNVRTSDNSSFQTAFYVAMLFPEVYHLSLSLSLFLSPLFTERQLQEPTFKSDNIIRTRDSARSISFRILNSAWNRLIDYVQIHEYQLITSVTSRPIDSISKTRILNLFYSICLVMFKQADRLIADLVRPRWNRLFVGFRP